MVVFAVIGFFAVVLVVAALGVSALNSTDEYLLQMHPPDVEKKVLL